MLKPLNKHIVYGKNLIGKVENLLTYLNSLSIIQFVIQNTNRVFIISLYQIKNSHELMVNQSLSFNIVVSGSES